MPIEERCNLFAEIQTQRYGDGNPHEPDRSASAAPCGLEHLIGCVDDVARGREEVTTLIGQRDELRAALDEVRSEMLLQRRHLS